MRFFKKPKTIYRENSIPLLIRWNLFECRFFSLKVHKLITSDDACLHDHPWAFITFLISGGYSERTKSGRRHYKRFSLLYRPANYTHSLIIGKPVYTLVLTFKKTKEWGFFTKKGWIPWYLYSGKNQCGN